MTPETTTAHLGVTHPDELAQLNAEAVESENVTTSLPPPTTGPHRTSLLASMDPAWVAWVLDTARQRLGMDIAWLSEFVDGQQHVHAASGDLAPMNVHPGMTASLEDSFCVRVLTGQLPPVITDAARSSRTRDLPVTEQLSIGSYVGAPVRTGSGEAVGMLCALSPGQSPHLDQESARHLEFLAQLISDHISGAEPGRPDLEPRRRGVLDVLARQQVDVVFQPVVQMETGTAVAYEALSRFPTTGGSSPAGLFGDAAATGLGVELEELALRSVLDHLDDRPRHLPIGINLSPEALRRPAVFDLLMAHRDRGIGVELTEHAQVEDYDDLAATTSALQGAGIKISVDDAGAGYASLRHILRLSPDAIKLDISLVTDVHRDPAKQALTAAMVTFATRTGAILVAEGVETPQEQACLRGLGVDYAQGYLFGRPAPLPHSAG